MRKSELPKALKPEDGFDFISNMPDAVLVLILSRLSSTEAAIRTSILSRRWRNLWTAIPSLDMWLIDMSCRKRIKKSEFKEFVYWVLASKTVDFDSFRLSCGGYYNTNTSTVWRWIHMAVARNVKQLNLSFCTKNMEYGLIELPHCLLTCDLIYHELSLPKVIGFPALRVFHLTNVDLMEDDDLVESFLQSCPLLEDLSLLHCVIGELYLLCISCPKLKRLSIINWKDDGCREIKIYCPKLVDLDLTGYIACNFFIEGVDSLKKVVFEIVEFDPTLKDETVTLHGNSHVKPLWMDLYFLCECIDGACDLALPCLKTLVLKATLDAFTVDKLMQILKYCPKLESLKLSITEDTSYTDYRTLDEVEIQRMLETRVFWKSGLQQDREKEHFP